MFHKHTKKKVLLTAAVLSAVSIPAYGVRKMRPRRWSIRMRLSSRHPAQSRR